MNEMSKLMEDEEMLISLEQLKDAVFPEDPKERAKVLANLEDALEHVDTDTSLVLIEVISNFLVIIILVHLVACGWFGLGLGSATGWTATMNLEDRDFYTQYTPCFG